MKQPIFYIACAALLTACASRQQQDHTDTVAVAPTEDSALQTTGANPPAVSTEEQEFRTYFTSLRELSDGVHDTTLRGMVNFPLPVDTMTKKYTRKDYRRLFSEKMQQKLHLVNDENITRIEDNLPGEYHQRLRQISDSGTAIYSVKVEDTTLFFGKVQGQYKMIALKR
ncbi:hypothetical protein ACFOTA_03505 [Chitinophaga sp. GCM10012297]|uniref:Uncharacterized protein n=1 Tax=Chitinophaga chungangae TaxID=2821488 RepID=A0ABS3Y997_9BACT|nr:hypothetical protein [Chitinophaga chungangae]MBO9151258.1 hypothetical protein [Chitinophaga chungangae]